jgi:hypothetical protein
LIFHFAVMGGGRTASANQYVGMQMIPSGNDAAHCPHCLVASATRTVPDAVLQAVIVSSSHCFMQPLFQAATFATVRRTPHGIAIDALDTSGCTLH